MYTTENGLGTLLMLVIMILLGYIVMLRDKKKSRYGNRNLRSGRIYDHSR